MNNKKWIILLTVLLVASIAANIVLAVALKNKSSQSAPVNDPGNVKLMTADIPDNSVIGEEMPTEDCFAIESDHCTFYLPNDYQGKITAENNGDSVVFSGSIGQDSFPLYTVYFNGEEGSGIGYLNADEGKISVRIAYAEYKDFYDNFTQEQKDEYDAMIETINVLVNQFSKLENYSAS